MVKYTFHLFQKFYEKIVIFVFCCFFEENFRGIIIFDLVSRHAVLGWSVLYFRLNVTNKCLSVYIQMFVIFC